MEHASKFVDMNSDAVEEQEFDDNEDLLTTPLAAQPVSNNHSAFNSSPSFGAAPTNTGGFTFGSSAYPPVTAYPTSTPGAIPTGYTSAYNRSPAAATSSNPYLSQPQQQQQQQRNIRKRAMRQPNTNVISAKLFTLASDVDIATGDPIFCKNCKAVFSSISQWKENAWTCEFCSCENEHEMEEEEAELLIGKSSVDYILEAPPEKSASNSNSTAQSEGCVIFCIDISGSMCVTTPVSGRVQLRGNQSLEKFKKGFEGDRDMHHNQFSRNEDRNVTYISRLQSVTAAVESQLKQLVKEYPNKKVGIVTFNREVTVIGDGASTETIVTGDKLTNFEELLEVGKKVSLTQAVEKSANGLIKKLYELEESGPTALGPALIVSVGICAANSSVGAASRIVLCTDGKANVGIGALDDLKSNTAHSKIEELYTRVGDVALEHGTSISVISIKGEDCRLEQLGALTDMTSGVVEQVDPLELTKNFADVLKVAVIATHVDVKLLLHKGLFVRENEADVVQSISSTSSNQQPQQPQQQQGGTSGTHSVTRSVGNVTAETEITFEYGVDPNTAKTFKDQKLPFQLQVRFTRPNGMRCIRVISNTQDVTWNREKAEEDVNIDILGKHAVIQSSKTAQAGDYTGARLNNLNHMNLWQRAAKTPQQQQQLANWVPAAQQIETTLHTETRTERALGMEIDDDAFSSADRASDREAAKNRRKANRSDSSAANLYRFTRK